MRSKNYKKIRKEIDANKNYNIEEAVKIIKKLKTVKFDESIEAHIRFGIDPKKGEQQVRGIFTIPHQIGKSKKIAAFVETEQEKQAKDAGAKIVGGEDLIREIAASGKIDFEVAIATPTMMKNLSKVAKILGPKGLMPSPKNETVTTNIAKTIAELKKGKSTFKNDNSGNVHQLIGKKSMEDNQIIENYNSFILAVKKAKPEKIKGIYIKNISVCSTMSPGIKLENNN